MRCASYASRIAGVRRVAALALLAACTTAPAATREFWGPTIEPPHSLSQIAPGMSVAEAKRRVPALREPKSPGVHSELVVDSGVSDVKLTVRLDSGTVASIIAIVQGQTARQLLTRAWGEPTISRDALGQPEVTWESEATGWKVKLDCLERNCIVEYLPYHALTAEYFGPHVVPPGDLNKLRIGMPLAEARTLAPAVNVRAGIPTKYDGVRELVALDDKTSTVRSIYLNLPAQSDDVIAEAWGPGVQATWPVNKPVEIWADPSTGWRALLRPALGVSLDLVFDNYIPALALLGDEPTTIEALPEPVLGRTVDEVKRAYKDQIAVSGRTLVITLPPTEWDRTATRITLEIAGSHVRTIEMSIPWKPHPPARDHLLELFEAKWGWPQDVVEDGKTTLVFRASDPRVEVREDLEHGTWQIQIR
jgi:hypothetical protein